MKPAAVVEISVPLAFSSLSDLAVIGLRPLVKVQTLYVKKTTMPQKPVDKTLAIMFGCSPLVGVLVCTAVLKANQTNNMVAIIDNEFPMRAELYSDQIWYSSMIFLHEQFMCSMFTHAHETLSRFLKM